MTDTRFNLLTFNMCLAPFLRHPYSRIASFSKQDAVVNADLINLQEVYTWDMFFALWKSLKHLPYYSFKPGILGPSAGLVTFSRHPAHFMSFDHLSEHKGVLISYLEPGIVVTNVHLMANSDGDWSQGNRFYAALQQQLFKVNELLENYQGDVILSGDFNTAKTSSLYQEFVSKGGWVDTSRSNTSPTFHKEFLPTGRQPQCIDYIFAKGMFELMNSDRVFVEKIDGQYLSNHLGLLAKVDTI